MIPSQITCESTETAPVQFSLASCGIGALPSTIIIVDRRAFFLGLLKLWVKTLNPDCEIIDVPAVFEGLSLEVLNEAGLLILGVGSFVGTRAWLDQQVSWIREHREDLPVAAIHDLDAPIAGDSVGLAGLWSHIPTSSSLRVAAAALHLVAEGGQYRPHLSSPLPDSGLAPLGRPETSDVISRLTPRERAVLSLLEKGMPNKIIAYKLGLSESTVKAHVHSIISKLKVRNRTEAAVAQQEKAHISR